jgi:O-antigen/teichoic acid export membrane protein
LASKELWASSGSVRTGIKRNTLFNLGGAVIPLTVSLVTVPIYLNRIGDARYGVIAVVWVLFGYFALFDFGLGRATTYHIARLKNSSPGDTERIFWTAFFANAIFGFFGAALLLLIGPSIFREILSVPPELQAETLAALPWLALAVPVLTMTSVAFSALEGQERFLSINVVAASTTILSQLAPLAWALWRGPDLFALIAAIVLSRLAGLTVAFLACFRLLPLTRVHYPDGVRFRTLIKYGGWITITGLLAPFLTTIDQLMISASLGARFVTYYAIPYNLANQISVLPQSLSRTLFPRFSMLEQDEGRQMAVEALLALAASLTPVIVFALGILRPFLRLWLGPSLAEISAPIGSVLLLGMWANGLAFIPFALLRGQGRPDLTAKFHLLELLPYILALWFGIKLAGLQGAAWAWTARVVADLLLLFVAARVFSRRCVLLIPTAVFILLAAFVSSLDITSTLWSVGVPALMTVASLAWSFFIAPDTLKREVRKFATRIAHLSSFTKGRMTERGPQ